MVQPLAKVLAASAILKAAGVGEFIKIAAAELALKKALKRAHREASEKVIALVGRTVPAVTAAEKFAKSAGRVYDSVYLARSEDLIEPHVDKVYKLAKQAAVRRLTGKIKGEFVYDHTAAFRKVDELPVFTIGFSFELVDQRAIDAIAAGHFFWFGDHYDKSVSEIIKTVISNATLRRGLGRVDAGVILQKELRRELGLTGVGRELKVPSGWRGTFDEYFEMLAANVTTTARAASVVQAIEEAGAVYLQIVNPEDERTCLAPNTPVLLESGAWRLIQNVRVGDRVITRAKRSRRVTDAFSKETGDWVRLYFDDGRSLDLTSDHPVALAGGGWLDAGLCEGKLVETLSPVRDWCRCEGEQILLDGVQEGGACRLREVQGMRGELPGNSLPSRPEVLLGCMRQSGVGDKACRENVQLVREVVQRVGGLYRSLPTMLGEMQQGSTAWWSSSRRFSKGLQRLWRKLQNQANRARETTSLFGNMSATACFHKLRELWSEFSRGAISSWGEAFLFVPVLQEACAPVGARDQGHDLAGRSWYPVRGRGENRQVGRGLLRGGEVCDRGGWDLLALKAICAGTGCEEDSGDRGERYTGSTDPGSKDERSCRSRQLTSGATRVVRVERLAITQRAYDLTVEEDESFVADGIVVHNCPRCWIMSGKEFRVDQAREQLDALLGAKSTEDVKSAQPWYSVKEFLEIGNKPGNVSEADSARFAAAGVVLPTYHGACRCSVDLAPGHEVG